MKGQFTDIKLPGINLANVKWPTLKKVALDKVETKVMNLNPEKFGTLLDNPFKKYCEDLWEPISMVLIINLLKIIIVVIILILILIENESRTRQNSGSRYLQICYTKYLVGCSIQSLCGLVIS